MELKKRLNKAVLIAAVAGSVLGTTARAEEKPVEPKKTTTKTEQVLGGKSEIRQKIGYLDEYTAAVERGENKEEAYRRLVLKMADNNQKTAEKMQKQIDAIQKEVDSGSTTNIARSLQITVICIMLSFGLFGKPSASDVQSIDKKLTKFLKSKGMND